jgi:putative ATPase
MVTRRTSPAPGDAPDLFEDAARERLRAQAPLAARLRPRSLDEIVGQDHLVGPGRPLRVLIEADRLSSVILWGPPGTGKTTLAEVMTSTTERAFERLSAVTAGVKDVREVIARAEDRLGQQGRRTILFLDEVHRFNKAQQDALLPAVESGLLVLIGATTENPFFEVNPPLLSRSTLFRLEPLGPDAITTLVHRGLEAEGATADPDAVALLVERSAGDGRHALTSLEVAVALAGERGSPVTLEDVEQALGTKALRYGRDDHYDVISAFIKSIRGSDPDAGLYWLARMLEAGEDARFIARRLVILASEDVGLADPLSLLVADAAARAVEFVGLPEAQLNLAQAVVHLATAPKSNRSALGIWRARQAVQETGGQGEVPIHLRDAHYGGARSLGHGEGYLYPHDDPTGWVPQQYRPPDVGDAVYYEPSTHGYEAEIVRRRADRRPDAPPERPGAGS